MKLSEFDYSLPRTLIAKYPSPKRGEERMLVVDREKAFFYEKRFTDICDYFKKGDLLVLNDTKVMLARLFGRRKTGGRVEIFIIDKTKSPVEALVRPSSRIAEGEEIMLDSGDTARVRGKTEIGRLVEFSQPIDEVLKKGGHVPLPPYISRPDRPEDRERYQTVFADKLGASAAPTAGLHFTREIIDKLKAKGVDMAYITLHVSYGTFAPVKGDTVEEHKMHSEFYSISKENVTIINNARNEKRKIFACGTTSLRALESCAEKFENFISQAFSYGGIGFKGFEGFTDLYVYPGYKFKMVDSLITNFHLPKSTLILLASAFTGTELLFKAYEYAIENKFRFFSYGDAMLIL